MKEGVRGGAELMSDGKFLPLLESTLGSDESNLFGCFSLLRQDEYNYFFGGKEYPDSGGFFKGVQHLNIYKENFHTKRT